MKYRAKYIKNKGNFSRSEGTIKKFFDIYPRGIASKMVVRKQANQGGNAGKMIAWKQAN